MDSRFRTVQGTINRQSRQITRRLMIWMRTMKFVVQDAQGASSKNQRYFVLSKLRARTVASVVNAISLKLPRGSGHLPGNGRPVRLLVSATMIRRKTTCAVARRRSDGSECFCKE